MVIGEVRGGATILLSRPLHRVVETALSHPKPSIWPRLLINHAVGDRQLVAIEPRARQFVGGSREKRFQAEKPREAERDARKRVQRPLQLVGIGAVDLCGKQRL